MVFRILAASAVRKSILIEQSFDPLILRFKKILVSKLAVLVKKCLPNRPMHTSRSLVQIMVESPWQLFFAVFSVMCTLALIITRIKGCLQPRPPAISRDPAFLLSGPVLAILHAIVKAMIGAQAMVVGGLDANFGILYGLTDAVFFCRLASICFLSGVVACALPSKQLPDSDPGRRVAA